MSSNATLSFRAHFDGKVIVPDEPVSLPVNEPFKIYVQLPLSDEKPDRATIERRLAAFDRFVTLAVLGANIPDEALRRENMYDDGKR